MTNGFLKVEKNLFKFGFTPIQILIIAQVLEFQRNTGDCYISDETLAKNFGVSERTVSRALGDLETDGYITRDTKNVRGGKDRHIVVHIEKLTGATTDKMSVVNDKTNINNRQNVPCEIDKLSVVNRQNDFIKENIKDNTKDNLGTNDNPIAVDKEWLIERHNELTICANGLYFYNNKFYKIK